MNGRFYNGLRREEKVFLGVCPANTIGIFVSSKLLEG
jgi:hypothetical protein